MTLLRIEPPDREPFERSVSGDDLVLGRSSSADVILDEPFVSQRHARFRREAGEWVVEDLGSRNGTFVNGERIDESCRIGAGDEIRICATKVSLLPEAPESTEVGKERVGGLLRPASEILERHEMSRGASRPERSPEEERLEILNEVHRALSQAVSLEEVLGVILDQVFEYLEPEEGAIYLEGADDFEGADDEFVRVASRTSPDLDGEYLYSETLLEEVAEKGMAALHHDLQADDDLGEASSIVDVGVRSLVAAPLLHPEGSLGMIALNSRARRREFSPTDLEFLVSVASASALRVRNVALTEELAERKRLEGELEVAREIQLSLLPDRLPDLRGWDLHGSNVPSRGVSGDYYEVVERLGGRELVLMLADVVGKGLPASLLTACLEALSAGPIEEGLGPGEIVAGISRRLYERTPPKRFATAFLGVLDTATGRLRYSNAGHNPPFVVRADGQVEGLEPSGPPLGALDGAVHGEGEVTVAPGDVLVLFTDGFVEAVDERQEEYGRDRLAGVCVAHRQERPEEMARAIESDLERFVGRVPFADDRTLVIARRSD